MPGLDVYYIMSLKATRLSVSCIYTLPTSPAPLGVTWTKHPHDSVECSRQASRNKAVKYTGIVGPLLVDAVLADVLSATGKPELLRSNSTAFYSLGQRICHSRLRVQSLDVLSESESQLLIYFRAFRIEFKVAGDLTGCRSKAVLRY